MPQSPCLTVSSAGMMGICPKLQHTFSMPPVTLTEAREASMRFLDSLEMTTECSGAERCLRVTVELGEVSV